MKNGCSVTEKVQIHLEKQNREAAPKMNSKWKRKKTKMCDAIQDSSSLTSVLSEHEKQRKSRKSISILFNSIQFNSGGDSQTQIEFI